MQIVERFLNTHEKVVYHELEAIAEDNGLRVFANARLSDVIDKGKTLLIQREFEFYCGAHFDFVITDQALKPIMVVEYDGPMHSEPKQQERDKIKNALCGRASLGILRIGINHVTRRFRGSSILRWIVEVTELE